MKNNLTIVPLTTSLGAEIRGVNLAELQLEDVTDFVDLLNLHKVLFFPDQSLTVDQHVAFGALFGEIEGRLHRFPWIKLLRAIKCT